MAEAYTGGGAAAVELVYNQYSCRIQAEVFPNLMKDMNLHIQEGEQIPSRINTRRSTMRYIFIKISKCKDKGRIL